MDVELECANCGIKFIRRKGEFNRKRTRGRNKFCKRGCCTAYRMNHLSPEERDKYSEIAKQNIKSIRKKVCDDLSPFRLVLKCCKNRVDTGKVCLISLEYLKGVWDNQHGMCPYTGEKLLLPRSTNVKDYLDKTPNRASLDRIDSSKGYVEGNVEFISLMAQYAKNTFTREQVIEFCKKVSENHK